MKNIYLTTVILLFFGFQLIAQTVISEGEVSGTWKTNESPFIIEGNISIAQDQRLTIQPGVEIYFSGPYFFEVNGRIDAMGTVNDSILFSVIDPSGFTSPDYNGWYGFGFIGMGAGQTEYSNLDYCIIEYSAGSGISCLSYSLLNITHSSIKINKDYGINLLDNSHINIEQTTINHNLNGGLSVSYSAPTVTGFNIHHNGNSGVHINGNSMNSSASKFTNGNIHNNNAMYNGGGVCVSSDAKARFHEVGIFSNSAINGGGVYTSFSHLDLSKVTLTDNSAQMGGGIYFSQIDGYQNSIVNTICWNNYPEEILSEGGQPDISYSDILGGYDGEGNINEDPWFSDSDNYDFDLSWSDFPKDSFTKSPCIDAGHPHAQYDPDGTRADIGAYYFHQTYTIPTFSKKNSENINVYPNPARNHVQVYCEEGFTNVQVIGLSGQLFKTIQQSNIQSRFDISDLKTGIYIIRIEMADGTINSKRLIKE